VTEQLLAQQLESPSGTGRDETPKSDQPASPHQHQTRMQTSTRILPGSYACPCPVRRGEAGGCQEMLKIAFTTPMINAWSDPAR
jgi:hypothetical protein